ncbi:MAG: hypothetical protein ACYCSN_20060 [Acidobacteriaceae bacterium]
MVDEFLLLAPHEIDANAWWYEDNAGITFVIIFRDPEGNYLGTEQRTIRWNSIRAALRRKDKESAAKMRRKK